MGYFTDNPSVLALYGPADPPPVPATPAPAPAQPSAAGDIEKALLAELGRLLLIPIAVENAPFERPAEGAPWAAAFFMPGNASAATLGQGGLDEHTGFFQVDLNYPALVGTKDVSITIADLREAYRIGRVLQHGSTRVQVTKFAGPRSREVDGFYRRSLTIYWTSRIDRPS